MYVNLHISLSPVSCAGGGLGAKERRCDDDQSAPRCPGNGGRGGGVGGSGFNGS